MTYQTTKEVVMDTYDVTFGGGPLHMLEGRLPSWEALRSLHSLEIGAGSYCFSHKYSHARRGRVWHFYWVEGL